jgi:urease accessory protein
MTRMFDATSPSETGTAPGEAVDRASALAAVAFAVRDGSTRLTGLRQRAPLRVLFPKHAAGDVPVAALVNVGGGLVAGDRAEVSVRVGPGAAALVTSQAAEKVYRSTGADCRVESRLAVEPGGWLEWCPQETILFDRARLRRSLRLDLAPGARAMLGEMVVLGRLAAGERSSEGFLFDRIEVRRGGGLAWLDSLRLEGPFGPLLEARAGLGGCRALATFVHAAEDAAERLELARALLPAEGVRAGATLVNGLLVVRWLALEALALRRAFALFWTRFREAAAGLPPVLPRLWHV